MKRFISFVLLAGCLFNSSFAVAECTSNRNAGIAISKPDSIYIDHGDGTVTDKETGLMWQKCTLGNSGADCLTLVASQGGTWQVALATANANADNGYDDWRLPNKNELESLVELACFEPAINETIFPSTKTGISVYWSSSPVAGSGNFDRAWGVSFGTGSVDPIRKNFDPTSKPVRLVRGGL